MAYQSIEIGTAANDGTGDTLRSGGDKVNDNFVEIYTLLGTGSALTSGISATSSVVSLASPTITGVTSFADGSAGAPSITNSGDTNTGIFFSAADQVAITTGGTARLTVSSTVATFAGNIIVPDDGDVGSASATDAMQISSAGIVTFKDDILIKDGGTIGVASSTSAITIASTGIVTLVDDLLLKDACTIGTATTAGAIAIAADGTVDLDVAGATVASAVIKTVGKESIWVPASAMQPTTSNGCSALTTVETTSGRPDMVVLDFDTSADEFAQFSIAFPKSYNLGTITFQAFWSGLAATTDCDWSLQGVAMNDNETIDVAYGTAVVVSDNAQGAVEELYVSAESGAVTIAGTPADNDLTFFRIGRDVSGDNMAGDARLHGLKIFFTTDATNDG